MTDALNFSKERGGWRAGPDEAHAGQLIPFDTTQLTSAANYSAPQPGDPCHPLASGAHPPAIALADPIRANEGRTYTHEGRNNFRLHNVIPQAAAAVRRLTPTECERLQGFPDGYTCLCGVAPYTTATCRCPDAPRYRALGNAVTVSVAEWIGRRLPR